MKAHRKTFSAHFCVPAQPVLSAQPLVANGGSGTQDRSAGLSDLDRRILGELIKVRNSQSSDAVATCIKHRRASVDLNLHRMLALGLVRRPQNSKNGFKITETGRTALTATGNQLSP